LLDFPLKSGVVCQRSGKIAALQILTNLANGGEQRAGGLNAGGSRC